MQVRVPMANFNEWDSYVVECEKPILGTVPGEHVKTIVDYLKAEAGPTPKACLKFKKEDLNQGKEPFKSLETKYKLGIRRVIDQLCIDDFGLTEAAKVQSSFSATSATVGANGGAPAMMAGANNHVMEHEHAEAMEVLGKAANALHVAKLWGVRRKLTFPLCWPQWVTGVSSPSWPTIYRFIGKCSSCWMLTARQLPRSSQHVCR